jgi:hypothetical protein
LAAAIQAELHLRKRARSAFDYLLELFWKGIRKPMRD